MSEIYKTVLTQATDLNYFISKLAEDPKNEKLQKQVELLFKCFMVYTKSV